MRPRKKVLIVSGDIVKASLTRFQLCTWGFAPMTASNVTMAMMLLRKNDVDAMLVLGNAFNALIADVHAQYDFTTVVTMGDGDDFSQADLRLNATASPAVLRETLKQATCRKRGPKPGYRLEEADCVVAG